MACIRLTSSCANSRLQYRPRSLLVLWTVLAILMLGCGELDRGLKPMQRTDEYNRHHNTPTERLNPVSKPLPGNRFKLHYGIPLETLLGKESRPAEGTLMVQLVANDEDASFECRTSGSSSFRKCGSGGDSSWLRFHLSQIATRQVLEVRSRTADGRVDRTPLNLVVENRDGKLTVNQSVVQALPTTLTEKQIESIGQSRDDAVVAGAGQRSLPLGRKLAVIVPLSMAAVSYGTSKTWNGSLSLVRRLGNHGGALLRGWDCGYEWDVRVNSGREAHCLSTPTRAQFDELSDGVVPHNHVELVRGLEEETTESLIVAAFDEDPDPAGTTWQPEQMCENATRRGVRTIGAIKTYFQESSFEADLEYCLRTSESGQQQWIVSFEGSTGSSEQFRGLYKIDARNGFSTPEQLLVHVRKLFQSVLVATAPSE